MTPSPPHALLTALLCLLPWCGAAGRELAVLDNPDCRFGGAFEQEKSIPGLDQALVSSGYYLFDCDAGIVWATRDPLPETLVMTLDGRQYAVAPDGAATQRPGKLQSAIGDLMLAMISGDEERLREDFELSANDDESLHMAPRSRRLRRALDHVLLRRLATDDGMDETPGVTVEIVTRDQQVILVRAQQEEVFATSELLGQRCAELLDAGTQACRLLAGDAEQPAATP
ncbi:hypothetical protein E4634_14180 [Mangrovimicrobium sediminis]|uniref:Curli production assembly/transport component CsgE n=1 Tax=Mangrovimicrobium sediminis TaxID=2562682 RepID=A0A4Z0M045_9GAMM|nr:hypothetical protein [Haliea sp. SAOS-164]TGD72665.1 hypothetical protein E4634_14180 [Haliea sp. SAOS-164]